MLKSISNVACASILMQSMAFAQDASLRPISEYMKLPQESRDNAYPFLRCIGLFRGVFAYGGASFSDELADQTQKGNEAMTLVAFKFRGQKHPDVSPDDLVPQMTKEIDELTNMYAERFSRNYTLTGEAWGADPVVSNDFETCGAIAQMAVDATS